MAVALALVVLAAGAALVYIGWKGLTFAEFWAKVIPSGGGA